MEKGASYLAFSTSTAPQVVSSNPDGFLKTQFDASSNKLKQNISIGFI